MLVLAISCGTQQAERLNTDTAHKRYLLAADYYGKGMIPAAQEELRLALGLDPSSHEALYLSGLIAMRQAVETEDLTMRAQCLPPAEARLELDEVDARMRAADGFFRRVVVLRPNHSEAWNALSAVALHFRRWKEAAHYAIQALKNASYQTPWIAAANLGVAYHEQKDHLRAAKELRQALAQNPKFCVARWRLGQVYYALAEYERAQEELQTLVEDRNCPIQEAYLLLGRVAMRLKDTARAEEVFKECRRLAPKSCVAKECIVANDAG